MDPSGHLAISRKLKLMDYRNIHNKVAALVAYQLGGLREVYVKGPKGKGYLDIYYKSKNSYHEVKSNSAINTNRTKKQLDKYAVSKTKYHNKCVVKSSQKATGSFYYGAWIIKYNYYKKGLISYTYKLDERKYKEYQKFKTGMKITAIAVISISVVVTGGVSIPGYVLAL